MKRGTRDVPMDPGNDKNMRRWRFDMRTHLAVTS